VLAPATAVKTSQTAAARDITTPRGRVGPRDRARDRTSRKFTPAQN
jgi:hypothetical protein